MADALEILPAVLEWTRTGVYTQLQTVPMIRDFEGTIDEAIDHCGLREYIENDIRVIASERTHQMFLQDILHKETFGGKYAHLNKTIE